MHVSSLINEAERERERYICSLKLETRILFQIKDKLAMYREMCNYRKASTDWPQHKIILPGTFNVYWSKLGFLLPIEAFY